MKPSQADSVLYMKPSQADSILYMKPSQADSSGIFSSRGEGNIRQSMVS